DLEIGTVVAALCAYNRVLGPEADAEELLREAADAESLILSGGIQTTVGSEVVLAPSCCCGLETWREWIVFAEGGEPPWCGHDPDPQPERPASGDLVLGYADPTARRIQVTPAHLREAMRRVERSLTAFGHSLERWAMTIAPVSGGAFAAAFARAMSV